jgi:hypothetical protein
VRTPAIRLLLLVFILERRFKGAAMQVEGNHIGGGEGALGQMGQEEFVDDSVAGEPNLTLFLPGRGGVGGHNDADGRSALVQALVWAVVEGAADPTFRTAQLLISRQVPAAPGWQRGRAGYSLCRVSHMKSRPHRRRPPRCHIGHRGRASSALRESRGL